MTLTSYGRIQRFVKTREGANVATFTWGLGGGRVIAKTSHAPHSKSCKIQASTTCTVYAFQSL